MLLFLDDVPSRLDNDRTALFYSVYDGNMWSEPVMIDDDGTADHIFSVAETENELLICWENNKNAYLSDVEEAVNNMEIKAVIYDKNTGTLGAPFEAISDDTYSYFEPNAAFIGDGKYLVTYNIYDDVKYENMDDAETLISDHLNRYSILAYRVYNSDTDEFVNLSEQYSMPDGRSDYFVDTSFHLFIDEEPETKTTSEEVILYAPDGETEIGTQIQDITTETGFYTQNITVREEALIDPYIVEYAVWKTKAIKDDRDVAVMAYIIDEDGELETTYDRPIFIKMFVDRPGENFESKPVLLANNGMKNSSLAFGEIDGTCVLFFISDSVDEEKPENNITKINYVNTINLINNIEKYDGYPYIDKTEGSDGELVRTLSNWDSKVNIEDLKISSVGSNMFISWITNENIDDDIKGVMNLIQVSYIASDDFSNITDSEEQLGNKLLKSSKVYELPIEQGEKRNVTESDLIYHGDKILAVWNALISDDYTIDNTSTHTLKYAAITPEPRLELSDIEIDGRALPGTNVSVGVSVFNNSLTDSTDNVTLQLYETKNGIDTLLNEAVAVSAYGAEGTLTGADTLELKTSYEVPEDFDDITFKAVLKTDSAPEIIKTKTFDISPKMEINTSPVVETIERDKIKISFEVINHGNSDFAGGYCNILQNGEFITNVYMPAIEIDDTAQIETFVDIADSMFTGEVNDPIYGYTEYIPLTIDTGFVEIPVRYDRKLSAEQVESMDQMGALKVDTKLYSMKEGSVQAINAYTENGLGVDGEIIYLSSNPNVVSVDSDGTIYAKEVGIAEITVMLKPANTDIDMAKSAYVRESNLATVPSKYLKTQIVTVYVTDTSTDEPELPIEPPTEPVAKDDEKIGEEVTEGQTTTFTVDEDKIEDTVKKASKGDTVIIPVLVLMIQLKWWQKYHLRILNRCPKKSLLYLLRVMVYHMILILPHLILKIFLSS